MRKENRKSYKRRWVALTLNKAKSHVLTKKWSKITDISNAVNSNSHC